MSFYIKLNQEELGAIFGLKHAEVLAYLYIKKNSSFTEGKTKKICFGAMAGMLKISLKKEVTRTDASRLIEALIKKELLSKTEEKQVYKLNFFENFEENPEKNTTKIDTITKHNITKHNKTSSLSAEALNLEEEDILGKEETGATSFQAATPPKFEKKGGKEGLTPKASQIEQYAFKNGWQFASNSKSLPIYEKAASGAEKTGQTIEMLLDLFAEAETEKTPMAFKIFIDNFKSGKRRGPPVGDMVL